MSRTLETVLIFLLVLVGKINGASIHPQNLDKFIQNFLEGLYDKYMNEQSGGDIYEQMQGDQPNNIDDLGKIVAMNLSGENSNDTLSDANYFRTMRNRRRDSEQGGRTKDHWIQALKDNILRQIGRSNMTSANVSDTQIDASSDPSSFTNGTNVDEDHIAEKIRSFYPSCEMPPNMEDGMWNDDNMMNLFFRFDYGSDEKALNIATATLRLYRIFPHNITKSAHNQSNCDSEEEKLWRVTIFWYTQTALRKKKGFASSVKRKICDSKVIEENARWVEFSVKPATKAWSKGRNMGLAVLVEDQEGNVQKAQKLFKGATCMVGASTPKPIPTIIVDATRHQSNEYRLLHSLLGGNATSPLPSDIPMLPTIDICTLEFPEDYPQPAHISILRTNACNLNKIHRENLLLEQKDKTERPTTLPSDLPPFFRTPTRKYHIRHQRQHQSHWDVDPRSRIVNKKIVMTNAERQALNLNITRLMDR